MATIRAAHRPEGGLRTLLAGIEADQPAQVREVQVADAAIHVDLDTPEDFLAGCRRFACRDQPTLFSGAPAALAILARRRCLGFSAPPIFLASFSAKPSFSRDSGGRSGHRQLKTASHPLLRTRGGSGK